jgi:hypothetical protein
MKYFLLFFLVTTNVFAANTAKIEIEYKNTTREKQKIILEKDSTDIICKVENQPSKKLTISRLKNLNFPLKEMKSVELCDKVITWEYNKKKQQSCYSSNEDFIINDILLQCFN